MKTLNLMAVGEVSGVCGLCQGRELDLLNTTEV